MKTKLLLALLFLTTVINAQIYVNVDAIGLEDGTSWANAYTDLNDALSDTSGTDIWIAKGIYTPGSVRTASFTLNNKKLYGGFLGTETMLSQRDFKTNKTILSGDLLGNDNNPNFEYANTTITDNVYRVITISGNTVELDGLTISGGNGNGDSSSLTDRGSAIFVNTSNRINVTISNVIIEKNSVTNVGVVHVTTTRTGVNSFIFNKTIFRDNFGKISSVYYSSMNATNVTLNAAFNNCLVYNNYIKDSPGGAGANNLFWIRTERSASTNGVSINNSTFTNNKLQGTGTGVFNDNTVISMTKSTGTANLVLNNNIFWNNPATDNRPTKALGTSFTNQAIANTIAKNNIDADLLSRTTSNKEVTLNVDPLFTDVANNDYTLTDASAAVGLGNNTLIPANITTDLNDNPRISLTNVDVGAFENQTATTEPFITFPDANLKTYLVSLTALDTNTDGEIQYGEASKYSGSLVLNNIGVTDLTGLEFFTNIDKFTSVGNALSAQLDLTKFTKLTEVIVRNSDVEDINFPNALSITKLDLRNNKLKKLNISTLRGVVDFNVRNNELTLLNVRNSNNANFTDYDSRDNPNLTCITVDDTAYSVTNWIFKDPASSFNTFCPGIIYVDVNATGNNNGSSWADAYTSLSAALINNPQETFWIAAGIYKPGTSQLNDFEMYVGQEIYGGFNGTETKFAERDVKNNKTILSGDLGDNDNGLFNYNTTNRDNSTDLITTFGDNIIIDGVTLQGAYSLANGGTINVSKFTQNLTVRNVIFKGNATEQGGIITAEPQVTNATEDYDYIFENCLFEGNSGKFATIMYVENPSFNNSFKLNVKFINSIFTKNEVANNVRSGTGTNALFWFRTDNPATQNVEFTNCTITENELKGTSNSRCGIVSVSRGNVNFAHTNLKINNTIFWNNKLANGNEKTVIDTFGSLPSVFVKEVKNSLDPLNFTTASLRENSITADPQFLAAANGDFRLNANSPAVDAGDNSLLDAAFTEDFTGNPRIFNTTIDMGAIEYNSTLSTDTELILDNNFKLYPNPTHKILTIETTSEIRKITVFNILGRKILETIHHKIDISNLKKGIYLLSLETEEGNRKVQKFMKK